LGQILTNIAELKKTIAQIDSNSSSDQTDWDKILSIPTFGILIASLVLTVLAVGLAVGGFFGFRSLNKAKEDFKRGTRKLRKEFVNDINEQKKKGDIIHDGLKKDQEESKDTTDYVWFLLNTHLGYIYWTISQFYEQQEDNGDLKDHNKVENRKEDMIQELIHHAISFTKKGIDRFEKVEDQYSTGGLTSQQRKDLNIANAKMNLAFFYAFQGGTDNKNYALQLLEDADSILNPLLKYDVVSKTHAPLWAASSIFVKRKFADQKDERDNLKKTLEDFTDRHPELKEKIQQYIKWSDT